MLRTLPSQVAEYLSTNYPVLWAVRMDLALALSVGLWAVYLPLQWFANHFAESYANVFTQNVRTGPFVMMIILCISSLLFWYFAVQKAAYPDIAPARQRHPAVLELFVGTFLILFPGIALSSAIADFGVRFNAFSSERLLFYVWWVVEPSVTLAIYVFLILRLSFKTMMSLLAVNLGLLLFVAWFVLMGTEFAPSHLSNDEKSIVGYNVGAAIGAVWLIMALVATQLRHTRARTMMFIALSTQAVPMLWFFVQGALINDLALLTMEKPPQAPWFSGYGLVVSWCIHAAISLLMAEWFAARWAYLNLAPK